MLGKEIIFLNQASWNAIKHRCVALLYFLLHFMHKMVNHLYKL